MNRSTISQYVIIAPQTLEEKYNVLMRKYESLKSTYEDLESEYANLKDEHDTFKTTVTNEVRAIADKSEYSMVHDITTRDEYNEIFHNINKLLGLPYERDSESDISDSDVN